MRIGCLIFSLFLATLLDTAKADYALQIVAEDLDFPWSVAFLPDRNYLVAMRTGEVRRISTADGTGPPLKGLPESYVLGQGGYFDIAVDPDFTNNQFVYLALAHGTPQLNGTRVVKGRLVGSSVKNIQIIFSENNGYGSAINLARTHVATKYFFVLNPDMQKIDDNLINVFCEELFINIVNNEEKYK